MRFFTLWLCLTLLTGLPAEARRRPRSVSQPATVHPSTVISPASTGFSPTLPFHDVNKVTLNTPRIRRGYGYYRRYRYAQGHATGGGIPGYEKSLPDRPLPGY